MDTVLGDAGYDAEDNPATPRPAPGVRWMVIALNRRGIRNWPKTRFRRQTVRRLRKKPKATRSNRVYGQRWPVESAFSRHKRRLGRAVRAVRWVNQKKELLPRAIVHNLMLLAAL